MFYLRVRVSITRHVYRSFGLLIDPLAVFALPLLLKYLVGLFFHRLWPHARDLASRVSDVFFSQNNRQTLRQSNLPNASMDGLTGWVIIELTLIDLFMGTI